MKQAASMKNLTVPILLPGIKIYTSPTISIPSRRSTRPLQRRDLETVRRRAVEREQLICVMVLPDRGPPGPHQ
jgi:hypothetical protein